MKAKFRTWYKAIPPKPIKLQIPGWAGEHKNHSDGCTPQPWHCVPFVEGSTYGFELLYPFDTETIVKFDGSKVIFEGNFTNESVWNETGEPPFTAFAPTHYGFTSSLDIQAPEGHVIRLESHPRFYTDRTGTVPIVVPGHIYPWWSRIFFVVFKTPLLGETHIFRKDEPYAQFIIIPEKQNCELIKMTFDESHAREQLESKISKYSAKLAKNIWTDYKGNTFNDKYKCLASLVAKEGSEAIQEKIDSFENKTPVKIIGRYVKKNKKPEA